MEAELNKVEKNEDNIDFSSLTYLEAILYDQRNFFSLFIYIIKFKIEIIAIFFYPEEFTHISLTLGIYLLDFLFSCFMNAFLYTDDVISEKYHNNGRLQIFTSLVLSLTSNIVSNMIMFFINKLIAYREYLSFMILEVNKRRLFKVMFKIFHKMLLLKIWIYFFVSIILITCMALYLLIFCQVYKKSQTSLLMNYLMSFIESLVYSVGISLMICIFRLVGIKFQKIYMYRTSVFMNEKF